MPHRNTWVSPSAINPFTSNPYNRTKPHSITTARTNFYFYFYTNRNMENTFLFPPVKRNQQQTTTTTSTSVSDPNQFKRFKTLQQPPTERHVSFRLLCHESRIGGLIGKSGSVIKQLQQETGSRIRVEDASNECLDRVVTIMGEKGAEVRLNLGGGEEVLVSPGQGGLVRVFERVLEVDAESSGVGTAGVVSCRMLAEGTQVGSVIGKGGKVIDKIRKDYGVKIRVLNQNLPLCAGATEEIVEIDGDVLAVKKALIAVSHRLQDCQPVGKTRITGSNPVDPVHQEYFPELPSSILPQRNSVLRTVPIESDSYASIPPFSLESERVSAVEAKMHPREVVFKILCSNKRIGGIIGKGGSIVNAIQNETGAAISVGPTTPECDERLITITALENPENRHSAAQKTVVLLFSRSVEAGFEKGIDPRISKESCVTARLVVSPSQVGCLLGKGGCIISEMCRVTSAGMKILKTGQVPKCVQQNDRLIQISGDFMKVKDAIYHVTGRLRDNLFSMVLNAPVSVLNKTSAYGRSPKGRPADALLEPLRDSLRDPIRDVLRDPVRGALRDPLRDSFLDPLRDRFREPLRDPIPLTFLSSGLNRHATTRTQGSDQLWSSPSLDNVSPPRLWASQTINRINGRTITDASRGLSSLRTGLEYVSGSRSVTVTNTTIEILVPEHVIGFVYGENGRNLARLKEISGAKVIVHEPRLGTSDRIVVISGTPDETQAAQSLLQAFILTGQ